jgi:soluble lytic murein transglycosylase-like protein
MEPAGLIQVRARISAIRERFRSFDGVLARAAARAQGPAGGTEGSLRADVHQALASAAAKHGLDPAVLSALVAAESGFRPDAVSADGAVGLTQLMPATARALGVLDPFDVWANLEGGARYLREQLDRFGGDLHLALAAYNAGPAAVLQHRGIPPYAETRRFVQRVLDLMPRFEASR